LNKLARFLHAFLQGNQLFTDNHNFIYLLNIYLDFTQFYFAFYSIFVAKVLLFLQICK
jgi:hypothetical protein